MKTLSDEISAIMDNSIKEILERTEGHKSARDYLIKGVCHSCILALTNTKYKKDEKILYDATARNALFAYENISKQDDYYSKILNSIFEKMNIKYIINRINEYFLQILNKDQYLLHLYHLL